MEAGKKEVEEKKLENLKSEEAIYNRQINYIIIKMLWQMREDKAKFADLYDKTGIGRNLYGHIIHGGTQSVSSLQNRAEKLQKETGVPKAYFWGKRAFEVPNIGEDEWKEYIAALDNLGFLRSALGESHIDAKKKQGLEKQKEDSIKVRKEFEVKLKKELANIKWQPSRAVDLYRAFRYFVQDKKEADSNAELQANTIIGLILDFDFEQLQDLSENFLRTYVMRLEEYTKLITTLYNYKVYQRKLKKQ